ncbi:MAG TPA: ABC transporter permease [Thermoanaerobaculia bacterium]|nr:ABC transporter permease [Thermoanaerobaculia bacterium]
MASPRWRKVRRDLGLHKARTLLVVLAIAIGILGAASVLDTWTLVRQATRDQFRASNPPSATLRTEAVDRQLLARVRTLPAVRYARGRRMVIASAQVAGGWRTAELFVVDDYRSPIGHVEPQAGGWPPGGLGIVVERSSVDYVRTAVGEELTLQFGGAEPVVLPVTGIARDVGLAPGWMDHVVYGFVTPATLARLGAPTSLDDLQIVVARDGQDREAIRRVAAQVKALVESTGRRVGSVDVPIPGRHIHAAQIDSLLFTQEAFGLLALLLSGFLVVNLISAMLAGQVREIGIMKAIGGRSGQIGLLYLGMSLALGVVASAVALPAAAVLGRAYARFTGDMLNFDVAAARIPASMILLQFAVGLLLPVVAAALPVLHGCRIPVSAALRDLGIDARAAARRPHPILARAGGLTRPLLLSLRNAFRRRQRMALTLATLAVGGAVYLGAVNLRAAIVGAVDLLFSSLRFDVMLRFDRPYPPAALEEAAAAVEGVARAEAWSGARATAVHDGGVLGNPFPIIAPPLPSRMLALAAQQGRWLRPGDGRALVVNRRLVEDEPGLRPGAEATLMVAGRPTRWRVVGVVESGLSPSAYARRETITEIVGGGATAIVVAAAPGGLGARLTLLQRLRSQLAAGGFEVQSGTLQAQQRKVVEDHLLMVAGFLGVMGQLMIVVGGLGLASTMSLAVLERTREIGVLRALGASHRSIVILVQVEGLVIALLSWAIALPLSVPMSVVLGKVFGRIMIQVPAALAPDASGVVRWLLVVVAVSLVACALPAWSATRISTAAALSYE